MDGIHDFGGKEGYGPIEVEAEYTAWHQGWEGRAYGIVQMSDAPDWTIDWWRHLRECSDPVDYLTAPYFASWMMTQAAGLIEAGVITAEEVIAGHASGAWVAPPPAMSVADLLAAERDWAHDFSRSAETAPRFAPGRAIRTVLHGHSGHSRLPAYLRGHDGEIFAHHGAHVLPDASARGEERAEHLYTVAFRRADLFPEAGVSRDRIFADLWESYLEPV